MDEPQDSRPGEVLGDAGEHDGEFEWESMVNLWGIYGNIYIIHKNPSIYPLVVTNSLLLKMAIDIVDFYIEHGDVQ